jgi:malate dehydrogenase
MIASGEVFGQEQPLILQLLDIEPAMGALAGLGMELDDCAFPLVKEVVSTHDPLVAFKVHFFLPLFIVFFLVIFCPF